MSVSSAFAAFERAPSSRSEVLRPYGGEYLAHRPRAEVAPRVSTELPRASFAVASFVGIAFGISCRRRQGRRPGKQRSLAAASSSATTDAQLDRCYAGKLREPEQALLMELRAQAMTAVETLQDQTNVRGTATTGSVISSVIWGVDVAVPSDATDVILLKFLRAAELDPEVAARRLIATLRWRSVMDIDHLKSASLGQAYEGHDVLTGKDIEGRPVLVSSYGRMGSDSLFADADNFLRYRIQVMERAMDSLELKHFQLGSAETLCQVHDYAGLSLLWQPTDISRAVKAITEVFGEHYPETKGRTIFLNVPAVYSWLFQAFSTVVPERTLQKFLVLGEGEQGRLIGEGGVPPEVVPLALGGMLSDPPGPLDGLPCQVVGVPAGASKEFSLAAVAAGERLRWEMRTCGSNSSDIAFEVLFVPGDGRAGRPRCLRAGTLRSSGDRLADEVVAPEAGTLLCRFRSDAWFQETLVVARGGRMPP